MSANSIPYSIYNPEHLIATLRKFGPVSAELEHALAHTPPLHLHETLRAHGWSEDAIQHAASYLAGVATEISDEALGDYPPDDNGHARALLHCYKERLRHSPELGWLVWDGTCYRVESDSIAYQWTVEFLRRRYEVAMRKWRELQLAIAHRRANGDGRAEEIKVEVQRWALLASRSRPDHGRVNAVLSAAAHWARVSLNELDSHEHLLPVPNGVIDLRTGELLPAEPSQRMTISARVEYDPRADYGEWEQWLRSALVDDEMYRFAQRWLGYAITGATTDETLLYVYGPGRSGKGTLTEALLALLGDRICRAVDYGMLISSGGRNDSQGFAFAPLRGARIVIASESDRDWTLDVARLKSLTGGDWISAAYKFRTPFQYRPRWKLILVSNHSPAVAADEAEAWARIRALHFPHSHIEDVDTRIKERMKSPEVLRGVLRWLVEGAMEYYQVFRPQGRQIPVPPSVREAVEAMRARHDSVGGWLADRCEIDPNARTPSHRLYDSYRTWCANEGYTPLGGRRFYEALTSRGVAAGRTSAFRWLGIRLREEGAQ